MKKAIIIIALLTLPIIVFGVDENSQQKQTEEYSVSTINKNIREARNSINKKIDDKTTDVVQHIIKGNTNSKHTIDFNINMKSDDDKKHQELPFGLLGVLATLYAGVIVLLSIIMGSIDTSAAPVQKFLSNKLKKITKSGFMILVLFSICIYIINFYCPVSSHHILQLIFLSIALVCMGCLAIRIIHYMSLYNILKEIDENDFNETLKHYIDIKEFDKFNRVLYEMYDWGFSNDRVKRVLDMFNKILDHDNFIDDKVFVKRFLKQYLIYLFRFYDDFNFLKNHIDNIISHAVIWFNKSSDKYISVAVVITEMIPKIIRLSLNSLEKNDDTKKFTYEMVENLKILYIYLFKTKSCDGLQNILISISELIENPEHNVSDDLFEEILYIDGVIRIYIKEYYEKDENKLLFENLRLLLKTLIEECFKRIKINKIQEKIIFFIRLHYDLMEKKSRLGKDWASDLVVFTKNAYDFNLQLVIADIVEIWTSILNSSAENKDFAKYLLERHHLNTKPEINKLLKR